MGQRRTIANAGHFAPVGNVDQSVYHAVCPRGTYPSGRAAVVPRKQCGISSWRIPERASATLARRLPCSLQECLSRHHFSEDESLTASSQPSRLSTLILIMTGNYFIDALSAAARQKLASQLQYVRLHRPDFLCVQGCSADWVHFPVTAVVSQFQETEDGVSVEVAVTGREGAVCLASLYNSGGALNSYQVLVGGSAWRIGSAALAGMVGNDPELGTAVMKLVDVQSKRMSRKLVCDRHHSVVERYCTWLLGLADRTGAAKLGVSHAEAARALGVHRPTITEASHALRAVGAIEQGNAMVTILKLHLLEELACECRRAFPVKPLEDVRRRDAA